MERSGPRLGIGVRGCSQTEDETFTTRRSHTSSVGCLLARMDSAARNQSGSAIRHSYRHASDPEQLESDVETSVRECWSNAAPPLRIAKNVRKSFG